MANTYCVLAVEVNGVELDLEEEVALIPQNLPFSAPGFSSDNAYDAIIEAKGGNFSYHRIETKITIPLTQTMVVPQISIETSGELCIDGELYLI